LNLRCEKNLEKSISIMLYEFRKNVSWNCRKNIQDIHQDRTPTIRTIKNWFAKFRHSFLP